MLNWNIDAELIKVTFFKKDDILEKYISIIPTDMLWI